MLAVALIPGACKSNRSPEAALDAIRQDIRQGKLDVALKESDREYQRHLNRETEWAWRFRVQKAHVLVLRGSVKDALSLLAESPPRSLESSDVFVRRSMLQGIASDYLQKFDEADKYLTEAQQLASAHQPALLGDVFQARGNLEISRKKYDAASDAFHQALELNRRQNLLYQEANVLGSLGYLAMWQEHYDEAIEWFKIALEKSRALHTDYTIAKILGNIGWNYSVMGDFESAEDMLKQAEKASHKAGLAGDQVKWLNALSDVYLQQHRYDLAAATSDSALASARKIGDNRDITNCLNSASEIALATDRVELAEKYNREALSIEQAGLDQFGIAPSAIISGRIASAKKQFVEAESTFQKILSDSSVLTPLKWQAESRLAQVYAAENEPAKAEHEFRRAIATIRDAQEDIQTEEFRVSFLAGAIQFYEAYIDFLVDRGRVLDALAVADLSRSRALARGLAEPSKSAKDSFSVLDAKRLATRFRSTILFYSLGEHRSYLWAITPAKVSIFLLPAEEEIRGLVTNYRDAILNSPADPLAAVSPGAKLYSLLVAPAAKFIPPDSRVIVLADGALDMLNFETLVLSSPRPHYWIEDVTIANANSLALLARANSAQAPFKPNLLLVGNAVSADPSFPALPEASDEISRVESYFAEKSRVLLTGAAATPRAYLASNPAQYAYIHFVTHGIASRLQPLESAVVLSPSGDSYKLYAREIITRPIHAYVVTISACNGAGNRAYAGEGLVGLSWAFLRAGARNVISALWEVSDTSTPQVMDGLYRGLTRGEDPAAALRKAKLDLVRSSTIYKKPFYWAPFQLYSGS